MSQGWRQEFSDWELTLLTRGLQDGFQGTIYAKNFRNNRFSPSEGGLACSDGGTIAPTKPSPDATQAMSPCSYVPVVMMSPCLVASHADATSMLSQMDLIILLCASMESVMVQMQFLFIRHIHA